MEPLHIYLFGGFLLERGHVTLPPIASRTGRSLFAYLVTHRDRPHQRDHLAGVFWPELPESRARRRLSHTLWQIQDVVNTEKTSYLDVTTDTLAFNRSAAYRLDVAEFDRSFESRTGDEREHPGHETARLRICVELYRGDFLAGYFDDWVLLEQDHYRQRYLIALRRLVDATKATGSYEEALSFARRLTHHDPLNEEAHQEVMRLCFLLGRTSDAMDQFERCRSVLDEELGTAPSAPTVAIYEKIVRQRSSGIRPLAENERAVLLGRRSDSPFVGREQERRVLVDSFERVLAGSGGVVLVEGEPGVGKTRTTLEAAEDARWRGFDVSWGACRPGALRPFAPLIEVLESLTPLRVEQLTERVSPVWLGEVAKLVPALGRDIEPETAQLRPAEESDRMIESLVHTVGALGRISPHLVIIDDLHWADRDTLSVLRQMSARLADSRVLLVLLYRSEEARGDVEVWDVLRDLDRSSGLDRVILSPLSVFELEEMVRRLLGTSRIDPNIAARLHRQTGGNVLFTLETLLAMRDRGLFESGSDPGAILERQMDESAVPVAPRVRSVIESRLSLLSDGAATTYRLAAIAGDPVDLGLIEAVTRFPRSMVLMAVDELIDRGLFVDDGSGHYRIAHDQVRQVVYENIETGARSHLHTLVAETLTDKSPDNVEAIGHHFREGGDSRRASSYLEMAGLRAIELNAFSTARSHLRSASDLAEQAAMGDVQRYTTLGHLEDVLNVLGRRGEQREVIEQMALLSSDLPALRGDVERRRAWLLAQVGQLQEAEASARRSVQFERDNEDDDALSNSLVALGTIQRWSGRPLEAVTPLEEAVAAADDEQQRADALTELASTHVEVQDVDPALVHLAEATRIYEKVGDLRGQAEVAGIEARILHRHGHKAEAESRYQRAIELCQRIGYRHGEGVNLTNQSNLRQLIGAIPDALGGYDRAAVIFAELGNERGEAMVLANSASARHNLLGDDDKALSDATTAMRHFAKMGDQARQAQCEEIVAGIEVRRGNAVEARRLLQASVLDLVGTGNTVLEVQHLRSLALLDIDEGEIESALSALDEAQRLATEADIDLEVELKSIRAMACLAASDNTQAIELIRFAASRVDSEVERPYLIHHRHARIAAACGLEEEARFASLQADSMLRSALAGLDREEFDRAIAQVPEHLAIITDARGFAPRIVQVHLPAANVPIGRPLEAEELRLVNWTIEHPQDERFESEIDKRRARLRRLLDEARRSGAQPSMEHLANALSVSASTIRRDLDSLRAAGHSVRTRGQRHTG